MTHGLTRPTFCRVIGILAATLLLLAAPARAAAPARPNIIFIITDDQGYGDLSCHGNPILKTPNLDRLHAESVRFTDFHVSPTCSPTRAALMTGRHEFKSGVTHTIDERERLSLAATTLPQLLKAAGYATGIFGKWHLGDEDAYQPDRRGFDEVFIHGAGGIGQTYPGSCGDAPGNSYFNPAIKHNGTFVKTTGYCTDVFFAQATTWIESAKGKAPFFAWIATNAPHKPLDCPPEYEKLYAGKVAPDVAKFFGMIANIDDNVGRLLGKLAEWNLERDTLIVFMTDNGGTVGAAIHNANMRGRKVTPYLGGTRAASLWRWPAALAPGDVDRLAAHVDVLPTLAELAGVTLPADLAKGLDGRSLVPLLKRRDADWPDRHLFTHVGRWPRGGAAASKYAGCAVRTPRYHLVSPAPAPAKQPSSTPAQPAAPRWELYDVTADPAEATDLAAARPAIVAELAGAYDRWWESVLPLMTNEDAIGPPTNPFKAQYWKQFGGGPQQ